MLGPGKTALHCFVLSYKIWPYNVAEPKAALRLRKTEGGCGGLLNLLLAWKWALVESGCCKMCLSWTGLGAPCLLGCRELRYPQSSPQEAAFPVALAGHAVTASFILHCAHLMSQFWHTDTVWEAELQPQNI